MGAGTFVGEAPVLEAARTNRRDRGMDMPLLVTVIALIIFGLVMMYSASWDYSLLTYGAPMYMFERQLMWLGVGLVRRAGRTRSERPETSVALAPRDSRAAIKLPRRAGRAFHACNVLQVGAEARRLWQFDARGGRLIALDPHAAIMTPEADDRPPR